jgi:osmotically-inducible protein OsmY
MAERVIGAVRAALGAEPRIDLAHHPVSLSISEDVLTMEGELADVAAKKLALERAASVVGVRHIVDRLRISPARAMADTEICDHLCDALLEEPAFRDHALTACAGQPPPRAAEGGEGRRVLEISVDAGVVTLAGAVPSLAHKRLAGVLAWWVPGTRDVVNGLEVVPPEEDSDDEILEAVRTALEKDPLVDADQTRVTARDGAVTLDGVVPSPEQREMAEADAWYVFGVDRVLNRILLRPAEHPPARR